MSKLDINSRLVEISQKIFSEETVKNIKFLTATILLTWVLNTYWENHDFERIEEKFNTTPCALTLAEVKELISSNIYAEPEGDIWKILELKDCGDFIIHSEKDEWELFPIYATVK